MNRVIRWTCLTGAMFALLIAAVFFRKTMILANQEYLHTIPIGRRVSFGNDSITSSVLFGVFSLLMGVLAVRLAWYFKGTD